MQRRRFTEEFKHEAVKLARQPGASVAAIARDLGIGANLLGRWVSNEFEVSLTGHHKIHGTGDRLFTTAYAAFRSAYSGEDDRSFRLNVTAAQRVVLRA